MMTLLETLVLLILFVLAAPFVFSLLGTIAGKASDSCKANAQTKATIEAKRLGELSGVDI